MTEPSEVAGPRRTAIRLAEQLGFSDERAGRAALIVSELATNLVKHARSGEILIGARTSGSGDEQAIEIVSVDAGPGMPDAALSRTDGYSTAGSLGHGLGAIQRQSDAFDLYTHTTGTVIAATLRQTPLDRPVQFDGPYEVGVVHVAKPGEDVCGDNWAWRLRSGRFTALVADGLGHGLHARDASNVAVDVFARTFENPPARVVEDIHAALRSTRGAAVSMIAVDLERGTARYSGLGNITGVILTPAGGRHHLVSHNGTAGHGTARIQEFSYAVPRGTVIVMASDGLSTQWDLAPYPGITLRGPSVIAAILYRDFSRRRDDVAILVVKERLPLAENM